MFVESPVVASLRHQRQGRRACPERVKAVPCREKSPLKCLFWGEGEAADERVRPIARTIRPALLGDAGGGGGQYRDAVAVAGDRPPARRRRPLGRACLLAVSRRLGGDGTGLGAPRGPPRPPRPDAP